MLDFSIKSIKFNQEKKQCVGQRNNARLLISNNVCYNLSVKTEPNRHFLSFEHFEKSFITLMKAKVNATVITLVFTIIIIVRVIQCKFINLCSTKATERVMFRSVGTNAVGHPWPNDVTASQL